MVSTVVVTMVETSGVETTTVVSTVVVIMVATTTVETTAFETIWAETTTVSCHPRHPATRAAPASPGASLCPSHDAGIPGSPVPTLPKYLPLRF